MNVDERDLVILKAVQKHFPLAPCPYNVLARELHIPADDLHRRVSTLRAAGVIRRLGPLFSALKIGRRGHLVAAQVASDAVDRLAAVLNVHDEITHNYLRSWDLNVWFTVLLREGDDLERILREVRACPGVSAVATFESLRTFKLDASFPMGDNADG